MTDNKLIDKLENDNIPIFSVSEITKEVTELLEEKYSYIKIKGEISGETGNKYPEIYFTLKDEENVISAIIKRNRIPHLKLLPEDGLEVICTGRITAYTKRDSKFQIDVDSISVEGEGQLLKMKEELRKKLETEGLFDTKYKKDIPFIPNKIGIITSPSGSVIKDMQRIIFERFSVPIELYKATVQGEKAVRDIIKGVQYFNNQSSNLKPDVLIIARGGGSIEDLWCFNNEDLVRSVFNSKIPIISAIGHEPDINIIDYVADMSLATPSHAAKKVVPERKELILGLKKIFKNFQSNYSNFFLNKIKSLDYCFGKLQKPDNLFNLKKDSFSKGEKKFNNSEQKFFNEKEVFVNKSGDFILAIGRDEKLENLITIKGLKKKETHKIQISKRKYKIQSIDGLPKNKVTPSEEDLKRIKKESKIISISKNKFLNETLYKSGFIWPVKGIVTGAYGNQRILNGQPRRPHYGLDIAAALGTKIISPSDAEVSLTMEDTFFNGKMVILNHGLGLNSIYSHLKKIHVKEGEQIKKGDLIAEVGSTGRSTGPHLDWRINVYKIAIDPELLLLDQPEF